LQLIGLLTDELFEFGDANVVLFGLRIILKEDRQAFQDVCLPMGEELGFEVVFAAELRLAGGAGQHFKDELGFELSGKRTSGAGHGIVSLRCPVYLKVLVQRKGRISSFTFSPR
jgi:hypothetical protein